MAGPEQHRTVRRFGHPLDSFRPAASIWYSVRQGIPIVSRASAQILADVYPLRAASFFHLSSFPFHLLHSYLFPVC